MIGKNKLGWIKRRTINGFLTLARLIDGAPPGPKKTFKKAIGNTSIASSYKAGSM
jgi:hypothetical protein